MLYHISYISYICYICYIHRPEIGKYIYIYNHYIDLISYIIDLISYICQKLDHMLDHSPSEDMMLTAAAEEFDSLDADEAKPRCRFAMKKSW